MNIHLIFHIFLLRKDFNNSHSEQIISSSSLVIIDEKEKYDVKNIINFRLIECHDNKRLQYKVSWVKHSSDRKWYSIENFDNVKKKVIDYHARYSNKFESHFISISIIKHVFEINFMTDAKILIKEIPNKIKRKMNVDIIKQTSIDVSF